MKFQIAFKIIIELFIILNLLEFHKECKIHKPILINTKFILLHTITLEIHGIFGEKVMATENQHKFNLSTKIQNYSRNASAEKNLSCFK